MKLQFFKKKRCSWVLVISLFSVSATTQEAEISSDTLASQRALYVSARQAFAAGNTQEYQTLLAQLEDYPLRSYLEYADITESLSQSAIQGNSSAAIDDFLQTYSDTYLAQRLERAWVRQLALQERWQDVLRHYNPRNSTTELKCYALHARLLSDDRAALREVEALWNVSRSQVNNCDPVFDAWIAAGMLTPEIAWQRFSKTVRAGRNALARYVATLMPVREKALANSFLEVDRNPHLLENLGAFTSTSPENLEIVLYGLRQLAVSDPLLANRLVEAYYTSLNFPLEEKNSLQTYVVQRLLINGRAEEAEALLLGSPELISESLVAQIIRKALADLNWPRVESWLDRLPEESRNSDRWLYWQARVLRQEGSGPAMQQANELLQRAAKNRSYFGFLAANQLSEEYEFSHQPVLVSDEQLQEVSAIPAIIRARELYLTGDEAAARNEWNFANGMMNDAQIMASGKVAQDWGWHRNSIQAMIRLQYWNDLELRFPLAYTETFNAAAQELSLQPHFLHAVARQESALMHDVRSSAGAMGLMQLMPATGREMAAKSGLRIATQDLLKPDINIALGSRYLQELLETFSGNRILVAAAYNAGPNRVRQWLQRSQDLPLPFDVWIETIPYGETRNYVESVLTYTVIYGHRKGERLPLFSEEELSAQL